MLNCASSNRNGVGAAVLAKKENTNAQLSPHELGTITTTPLKVLRGDTNTFMANGVDLAGGNYLCYSAKPDMIRRKKRDTFASIVATRTCVVIVVAGGVSFRQVNGVVESLGHHLRDNDM